MHAITTQMVSCCKHLVHTAQVNDSVG